MKLRITVQAGSLVGKTWELTDGFLTIGRDENCHLNFDKINEKLVSTKHAFLRYEEDGFYLTDNKSTNGTFINGNRIERVKLNAGDIVQFGANGGPQAIIALELPQVVSSFTPPQDFGNQVSNQNFSSNLSQPTVLRNPLPVPPPIDLRNSLANLGL